MHKMRFSFERQDIIRMLMADFVLVGAALVGAAFFADSAFAEIAGVLNRPQWNGFWLFCAQYLFLPVLVWLAYGMFVRKEYRQLTLLVLALLAAFEVTYLLKLLFQSVRPMDFDLLSMDMTTRASAFSFPGQHAALLGVACCFVSPGKLLKIAPAVLLIFAGRMVLGFDYLSDLLAGAGVGVGIALQIRALEKSKDLTGKMLVQLSEKLEVRRQFSHLLLGSLIVSLVAWEIVGKRILFLALLGGGALILWQRRKTVPLVGRVLSFLERPEVISSFPGKGAFFMLLGIFVSLQLFTLDIALAASIIMVVGDSVSHLVGRYFGRVNIPRAAPKKLEGAVAAVLCATLAAMFFVDFWPAFWASAAAMSVEVFLPPKLTRYLDDNLVIPIVAGTVLVVLT